MSNNPLLDKLNTMFRQPLLDKVNNTYFLEKSLIYIAILSMVLYVLLLVVYTITIISYIVKSTVDKAPFNIETIEYASIYSLTVMSSTNFNYTYFFIILLGISFISLVFYRFRVLLNIYNYFNGSLLGPTDIPEINHVVFISLIALAIAIISQSMLTYLTGASISRVEKRTNRMNSFVRSKIYKNSKFSKKLEAPTKDILYVHKTINECLKMVEKETDATELAKAFYTITLYNYYQNFSLKNQNIYEALKLFKLSDLLTKKSNPYGYMPRYGTFIEDIGESIIRPVMPSSSIMNEAMYICDGWISLTNEYANTVYPSEAYNSFSILILITYVIQVLLLSSIYYYGIKKPKTPTI